MIGKGEKILEYHMHKLGMIESIKDPPQIGEHGDRRAAVRVRRLNDIWVSEDMSVANLYNVADARTVIVEGIRLGNGQSECA